ncbi:MAG TPA: hypothetical protein VI789_03830 [Dehalococcoidia bacterium]|nr:hypothetical protein [Dehalococcoidia bacterium]
MAQQQPATAQAAAKQPPTVQVGKRYFCSVCSSEFVVTKAGAGNLECHGQPMQLK